MIGTRKAIRSDAACHSADVLTPTERAVERLPKLPPVPEGFVPSREMVYRDRAMRWGDVPEIRKLLQSIRGSSCT